VRTRWWEGGFFLSGWWQELGWGVRWSYLRIRGRACSKEEDPVVSVSGFRGRAMEELVVTEEGKVVK